MPQLDQLAEVALSQFFWLAIVLGTIYFVIGKGMLPKIQSTVDMRADKIAGDLAAAEAARKAADDTEAAYRERMDAGRADAAKLTGKAKDESAKATEKTLAKADAERAEAVARQAELRRFGRRGLSESASLSYDIADFRTSLGAEGGGTGADATAAPGDQDDAHGVLRCGLEELSQ